ncbi:unnamed protein product, partial [Amaranthus hypochondriacus]
MGDGGVACVPLQPIMDKFPGSESFCGGGGGSSNNNGNVKLDNKPVKKSATKRLKLRRDAFFKKEEPTPVVVSDNVKSSDELVVVENAKDEVEEGELGTLKSPIKKEAENGELTSPIKEKGEIVTGSDRWVKENGLDRGSREWRKYEPERLDFSSGRFRSSGIAFKRDRDQTPDKFRKGEYDKAEFGSWRASKGDVEKGEFIPDRWHKEDYIREEYGYCRDHRYGSNRDRERRYERDFTPSSHKYSAEDVSPVRDFNRSGNHRHSKRPARWEVNQERSYSKLSSKILNDIPDKDDYGHGRSQPREYSTNARLKRHGTYSENSDRYYDDYGDYFSSKSRKLSSSERYSRQSTDTKSCRNPNSSKAVADRLSMRHFDSTSARGGYDRQRRSPSYSDRSPPCERAVHHDHRDRTPARHERSPCFRGHRNDKRNRSPSYVEKSTNDRVKIHDYKERSPSFPGSPHDLSRLCNNRQSSRSEVSETKQNDRVHEEKPTVNILNNKDLTVSVKDHLNVNGTQNHMVDISISDETHVKDEGQGVFLDDKEQTSQVNGVDEEIPSMEEDMDISDTPPHVPCMASINPGKWYYLDHLGEERGPSKLCDLKSLVVEGILMSDHLVKHSDVDRWMTVENAASPAVTTNFSMVFSETVTQLVNPPEAPGNVLEDVGDAEHSVEKVDMEILDSSAQGVTANEFGIDERVGALLDGVTILPGRELETVGEVLQVTFDQSEWERFGISEGFMLDRSCCREPLEQSQEEGISRVPEATIKDAAESTSTASLDKECSCLLSEFTEWFSCRWSCKGGDWRRNEEAVVDKFYRKKLVLNDGYPLCQMVKSGYEDPRWQTKDDLYYPCQSKKLDLPLWAFSWVDERNDSSIANKLGQTKSITVREVKGSMMPVIRINACVVTDNGSSTHDSRLK